MTCAEALDRMLEADPVELRGMGESDLAVHLLTCAPCRETAADLTAGLDAIADSLATDARTPPVRASALPQRLRIRPPWLRTVALTGLAAAIVFAVVPRLVPTAMDVLVPAALANDLEMIDQVYTVVLRGELEPGIQRTPPPDMPWLGLLPCPADLTRSRGGVEICALSADGPLGRVGARPSELLVSIDGARVTDAESLYDVLAERKAGDEVNVGLAQGNDVEDHRVRLVTRPASTREVFNMRWSPEFHALLSRQMSVAVPKGTPPALPASAAPVSTIDTVMIDRVQVIWRSHRLVGPTFMAAAGDRLIVADRGRVHIVPLTGRDAITVGGGAAKDAFGRVYAVGALDNGEFVVLDGARRRLTALSTTGEILGSRPVAARQPFINWWPRGRLVPWSGGLLFHVFSGVELGRTTRHSMAWLAPHADTALPLRTWDGETLANLGGVIGPAELFGPTLYLAVSADGRVASGDGLEYCIAVESLAGSDQTATRRFCHDRPRTPVGSGIRDPDLSVLPRDRAFGRQSERMIAAQRVGQLLPSYDRLLWSEEGELWVRTLGADVSNIHPRILASRPDLGPSHRAWDVFDAEGRYARTVRLPTAFDPQVIMGGRVYGFYRPADESVGLAMVGL